VTINRKDFCSCALAALAAPAATAQEGTLPVSREQVIGVLKWLDGSADESLRAAVFARWGRECFVARNLDKWALRHRADFEGFVAWVNRGESRFWEKIDYDKTAGTVKVTGRKSSHCACAWAQCAEPPKSLCRHCCRAFQREIFSTMLDRQVEVEVTEAILLGGERCCTAIRVSAGTPAPR
jgi:hypothetical protein